MRKRFFIFLFFFLPYLFNYAFAFEMFISGIYQQGSFRDEPKPARSEYLRVKKAGFNISGEWAEYKLSADIITWTNEPFLIRVEYENPLNAREPFIQESLIDPSPGEIELTSPYVEGLEVKKDYYVKITLYASKDKEKALDRFTQYIRSYVDSTSRPVKFWSGIRKKRY